MLVYNPKRSKIDDCRLVKLDSTNKNQNIEITVSDNFYFETKRIYYLYDVPFGSERGGHAHKDLYQLIIAPSGSFNIILFDGKLKKEITLNEPNVGLLIVPGIWRELNSFSSGSLCLVLASELYKEDDYIRCLNDFKNFKEK
jgi:hypothetical protein